MKTQTKTIQLSEDEFSDYVLDLEEKWQHSLPRCSGVELLQIFPEGREVIPEKLEECEDEKSGLVQTIKKKLTIIKNSETDWGTKLFWREWIKVNDGERLLEIDSHISKLKRLLWTTKGQAPPKGRITQEQIDHALAIPIENLIDQALRKGGKVLVGLCPLHNEKHPSFYIYTETNTCWCYGCQKGGDTINLIKLLHGLSFPQAVQWLNKQ